MTVGRIVGAVVCFLVFGSLAVVMGRSALADWREGESTGDLGTKFYALGQWWPTLLAAVVALGAPVGLLATSP